MLSLIMLSATAATKRRQNQKQNFFRFWKTGARPNASVILFRHVEKTGGVSLRSSLQASTCQLVGRGAELRWQHTTLHFL